MHGPVARVAIRFEWAWGLLPAPESVSLGIPCVSGPCASLVGDGYERIDTDDTHFSDHLASVQSISTSSTKYDSGLFEANLRDVRHLPFEYSGAINTWQMGLPADPRNNDPQSFDYSTLADVV